MDETQPMNLAECMFAFDKQGKVLYERNRKSQKRLIKMLDGGIK